MKNPTLSQSLDKFYTNPSVVQPLLSNFNFNSFDLVIEPSAGSGSFSNQIIAPALLSFDLLPEAPNIIQQDWFEYTIPSKYKRVLIIGNPPFGKSNNLSASFLKHSFQFPNVHTVAFVLPNVYKKHTLQRIIPSNFSINKIIPLPKDSFLLDDKPYHVPCSFFIFSKELFPDLRQPKHLSSPDFSFGSKNDYDFFIFGSAPQNITLSPSSNNRGHFIKSNISKTQLIKNFNSIDWVGHSSAPGGVYWLTKTDLVENYLYNQKK